MSVIELERKQPAPPKVQAPVPTPFPQAVNSEVSKLLFKCAFQVKPPISQENLRKYKQKLEQSNITVVSQLKDLGVQGLIMEFGLNEQLAYLMLGQEETKEEPQTQQREYESPQDIQHKEFTLISANPTVSKLV